MSRYIDKDLLISRLKNREIFGICRFCDFYENCSNHKGSHKNCWCRIGLPEVDAVEVARCKDCKHWEHGDCWRIELTKPDDYCSFGEKHDD